MSAETVPTVRYAPYGLDNLEDPSAVRDLWFVNDDIDGVEALRSSGVLDESVAVVSVDFDRLDLSDLSVLPQARTHVVYPSTQPAKWVETTLRAFAKVRAGHVSHHPYDMVTTPDPIHEVAAGRRPKGMGGEVLFAPRSADTAAPNRRLRDDYYTSLSALSALPKVEWIAEGRYPGAGLTALIGPPGVGKSAVALDLACRVGVGRQWAGANVTKGRVLYLIGEAPVQLVDRSAAWAEANGTTVEDIGDGVAVLSRSFPLHTSSSEVEELMEIVEEFEPTAVIIDTMARFSAGMEENSATDVGRLVAALDRIVRVSGAGVMVVHHTTRGTSHGRGSTALLGAVDSELLVEEDPDAPDDGPRRIRVLNTKNKFAPKAAPLTFVFEQVGDSFVLEPVIVTDRREVVMNRACLAILDNVRKADGPITRTKAKERAGKKTTATEAVKMLVARGHLVEVPGGQHPRVALGPEPFTPTETGGVALDPMLNTRFTS